MKLWILERTEDAPGGEYDCANGFVVRAESEPRARELISISRERWSCVRNDCTKFEFETPFYGDEGSETWLNPEFSTCTELVPDGETEIILVDFNAG